MSDKGLPKNYFKDFTWRINSKIDEMPDALEKNSPLLYSMRLLNGYKTPLNYFSNLKAKTLKLHVVEKGRVVPLNNWVMTIAAGFCIILASIFVFSNANNDDVLVGEEFVFEDAYDYYDINPDEIDLNFLSEIDVDENEISVAEIEEEELESYVNLILDDFSDLEIENLY